MRSATSSRGKVPAFLGLLRKLAPLRLMLLGASLLIVVLVPEAGTRAEYRGWGMVPTLIVPALVPIAFMMLLLDALMHRVLWVSKPPAEHAPHKLGMALDLLLVALLVAAWLPYFLALAKG